MFILFNKIDLVVKVLSCSLVKIRISFLRSNGLMNSEPKTGNPTNCAMNRKIEATFERLVKDRNCRAVEFASKSFKPLLIKIGPSGSNGLSAEVAHGAGFDLNITVLGSWILLVARGRV